ncbi:hypothetical protein RWV98_08960 [Agathobaculum sp. NTUH-O15-33]|uniref:hypothetical protein n=1 Tax=Agathobaculum sp. NTUH-O15-33 TaxID=3079302 RepID=UPI0029589214|nr:hypothetical protein [Agathobaculum sp. NTUH-O15-33]WNX86377.1 hypothetical protein RWV98_08960 [Agathobaculum sp. NTUH-O15-33]
MKDLTEAWEDVYTYIQYGERLFREYPTAHLALGNYLWQAVESSLSKDKRAGVHFSNYIREALLSVLEVEDIKKIPITDRTVTGLGSMYFVLFQSLRDVEQQKIPPVPREIETPEIIQTVITRYRMAKKS